MIEAHIYVALQARHWRLPQCTKNNSYIWARVIFFLWHAVEARRRCRSDRRVFSTVVLLGSFISWLVSNNVYFIYLFSTIVLLTPTANVTCEFCCRCETRLLRCYGQRIAKGGSCSIFKEIITANDCLLVCLFCFFFFFFWKFVSRLAIF